MAIRPRRHDPLLRRARRHFTLGFGAALIAAIGSARAAGGDDLSVRVSPSGDAFDIDVVLRVHAPLMAVWDVLTDFDGMARIVSNLRTSRVVSREGNRLVVAQEGVEVQGPLRFDFHSLREVELSPPFEMVARLIRGSMRGLEGWTRLARTADATLVSSHGRLEPGHWVPSLLAPPFMERATARQYAEMRAEMLRRAAPRST